MAREEFTTRRGFLAQSGSVLGGAWLAAYTPAIEAAAAYARAAARQQPPFETLTVREAADLDAIASLMIPTDETPGAREAGVVYFIDRSLGSFFGGYLAIIRTGLTDLGARVRRSASETQAFADLTLDRQEELLREVEQEDANFFFFARTLVVMGMFANPSYGGNRDKVGWALLGFEDKAAFQPPFGYYDAESRAPEQ